MNATRPGAAALSLALVLALAAPQARAGDVEGTVTLPDKGGKKTPKPGRYPGAKPATGDYERGPAVVFIDGVTQGAPFPLPKEKPKMAQQNRQFRPLTLAILEGTTVEFPNDDDEYHNVFSHSKTKELELGRYGKGEAKEVTFDQGGLVRLRCEVHSQMHAVILILKNPYFTITDDKGNFSIPAVPAGKYKIYAFHEDYEPKDKTGDPMRAVGSDVEVAADGKVKMDFNLGDK
ncbi:MAG: hypothetical protein HYZ53_05525 [Planctomycetes bacterium]|nr:hypothetical protein [Planctomycetota bacterium]